jgi:hypothetical protein
MSDRPHLLAPLFVGSKSGVKILFSCLFSKNSLAPPFCGLYDAFRRPKLVPKFTVFPGENPALCGAKICTCHRPKYRWTVPPNLTVARYPFGVLGFWQLRMRFSNNQTACGLVRFERFNTNVLVHYVRRYAHAQGAWSKCLIRSDERSEFVEEPRRGD